MSDEADIANDLAEFAVTVALRNHAKPVKASLEWCDDCGIEIPEARRQAVQGVDRCIDCAREQEKRERL